MNDSIFYFYLDVIVQQRQILVLYWTTSYLIKKVLLCSKARLKPNPVSIICLKILPINFVLTGCQPIALYYQNSKVNQFIELYQKHLKQSKK